MKLSASLIFCIASLLLTIGLSFLLYPYATLSPDELANLNTPKPMEDFDEVIDLGEDYGALTLIDLMGYYLDNPPVITAGGQAQAEPARQFGGC